MIKKTYLVVCLPFFIIFALFAFSEKCISQQSKVYNCLILFDNRPVKDAEIYIIGSRYQTRSNQEGIFYIPFVSFADTTNSITLLIKKSGYVPLIEHIFRTEKNEASIIFNFSTYTKLVSNNVTKDLIVNLNILHHGKKINQDINTGLTVIDDIFLLKPKVKVYEFTRLPYDFTDLYLWFLSENFIPIAEKIDKKVESVDKRTLKFDCAISPEEINNNFTLRLKINESRGSMKTIEDVRCSISSELFDQKHFDDVGSTDENGELVLNQALPRQCCKLFFKFEKPGYYPSIISEDIVQNGGNIYLAHQIEKKPTQGEIEIVDDQGNLIEPKSLTLFGKSISFSKLDPNDNFYSFSTALSRGDQLGIQLPIYVSPNDTTISCTDETHFKAKIAVQRNSNHITINFIDRQSLPVEIDTSQIRGFSFIDPTKKSITHYSSLIEKSKIEIAFIPKEDGIYSINFFYPKPRLINIDFKIKKDSLEKNITRVIHRIGLLDLINIEKGFEIKLNNENINEFKYHETIYFIPIGKYSISCRHPDFQSYDTTVSIKENSYTSLIPKFKKNKKTIFLNFIFDGYEEKFKQIPEETINYSIAKDDYSISFRQRTSLNIITPVELEYGGYKINVDDPYFNSTEKNIVINSSVDSILNFMLEFKKGNVRILISPKENEDYDIDIAVKQPSHYEKELFEEIPNTFLRTKIDTLLQPPRNGYLFLALPLGVCSLRVVRNYNSQEKSSVFQVNNSSEVLNYQVNFIDSTKNHPIIEKSIEHPIQPKILPPAVPVFMYNPDYRPIEEDSFSDFQMSNSGIFIANNTGFLIQRRPHELLLHIKQSFHSIRNHGLREYYSYSYLGLPIGEKSIIGLQFPSFLNTIIADFFIIELQPSYAYQLFKKKDIGISLAASFSFPYRTDNASAKNMTNYDLQLLANYFKNYEIRFSLGYSSNRFSKDYLERYSLDQSCRLQSVIGISSLKLFNVFWIDFNIESTFMLQNVFYSIIEPKLRIQVNKTLSIWMGIRGNLIKYEGESPSMPNEINQGFFIGTSLVVPIVY